MISNNQIEISLMLISNLNPKWMKCPSCCYQSNQCISRCFRRQQKNESQNHTNVSLTSTQLPLRGNNRQNDCNSAYTRKILQIYVHSARSRNNSEKKITFNFSNWKKRNSRFDSRLSKEWSDKHHFLELQPWYSKGDLKKNQIIKT